jgi:hypothetical protein
MHNFPIIIKNVLPIKTFLSINDEFRYAGWQLTNYSDGGLGNERKAWKLNDRNTQLIMFECASIIKLKIKKYLNKDIFFIRAHSNGSTFGQTSNFHIDFDEDDVWTFILFSSMNWNTQWGGEFVCFDPINKEYKYVPYIPNTGCLIPSNWHHYGSSPNETTDCLRTTLAFSFCSSNSFESVSKNSITKQFL